MRATLLAAAIAALAVAPAAALPADRAADTPDLMQSHPEARLPGGGQAYCGPVAVSNSLVWLARQGHPRLAPADATPARQGALAALLGSPAYMGTSERAGTGAAAMATGLARYLAAHGAPDAEVRFRGCNPVPPPFGGGVGPPDPAWIARGLDRGAAWLKIGWYEHDRATGRFRVFAGHWVTVVGLGRDGQGRPDPTTFVVHDPAPRSGPAPSHDVVRATPLPPGVIDADGVVAERPTRGWLQLGGGLRMKAGADVAILDGALVLTMPDRSSGVQELPALGTSRKP